jgi:hypothetical protein
MWPDLDLLEWLNNVSASAGGYSKDVCRIKHGFIEELARRFT